MSGVPTFLIIAYVVHATLRRGVEPCHDDTRVPTPRRFDDVKRQDHDGLCTACKHRCLVVKGKSDDLRSCVQPALKASGM